jgi:hypothetical protein
MDGMLRITLTVLTLTAALSAGIIASTTCSSGSGIMADPSACRESSCPIRKSDLDGGIHIVDDDGRNCPSGVARIHYRGG